MASFRNIGLIEDHSVLFHASLSGTGAWNTGIAVGEVKKNVFETFEC